MRDRTFPAILPDEDSDDLQAAYKAIADLAEDYNSRHVSQIAIVQFDVTGRLYGGMQRDYRGCYVSRFRSEVV